MAHRSMELLEDSICTEREKFAANLKTAAETSRLIALKTNELNILCAEIASRIAELRSLEAEVNAMAVKWGLDPIPVNGILTQFEEPNGILLAMSLESVA